MTTTLIMQPTTVANWHALIHQAQLERRIELCTDIESYLVYLLMRFSDKPDLLHSVIAMDFVACIDTVGRARQLKLQELGDKCLLLSGLFPGRAQRKRVRVSYFVDFGQFAYAELAQQNEIFSLLANGFVGMMDVLQALRVSSDTVLSPLAAQELLEDTRSQSAQAILQSYTSGFIISTEKNAAKHSH
jgi:hypothetical protein